MQSLTIQAILIIFLISLTLAVILSRDLLACIIMFSAFSFTAVLAYFMFGSPDVAFTEAVIGTMSTVFFIIAVKKVDRWAKK